MRVTLSRVRNFLLCSILVLVLVGLFIILKRYSSVSAITASSVHRLPPRQIILTSIDKQQNHCGKDWLSNDEPSADDDDFTPKLINIAFLLVNNKNYDDPSRFIKQACRFIVTASRDKISAKFFVFNMMTVKQTSSFHVDCGQVIVVAAENRKQKSIGDDEKNKVDLDRCDIYLRHSDEYGFFNANLFQFVFSFDVASINLTAKINVANLLSEGLTIFLQPSLIGKNGRWSKGAAVYSSKLFLGYTDDVAKFCKTISEKPTLHFQSQFDKYFRTNKINPRAIFLLSHQAGNHYLLDCNKLFTRRIEVTFPDKNELDYWKFLEVTAEKNEARKRQQKAATIVNELQTNYFNKMSRKVSFFSPAFVTAACRYDVNECKEAANSGKEHAKILDNTICQYWRIQCHGLGDRLRGTVTAFYMAVAMNRLFHIDWVRPGNVAEYFLINEHFYNTDDGLTYDKKRRFAMMKNSSEFSFNSQISESAVFEIFSETDLAESNRNYLNIAVTGNRFVALEGLARNNKGSFKKVLKQCVPSAFSRDGEIVDFLPLISAAYQTIFAEPNEKLIGLFDEIIRETVGHDFWKKSVKIGVQVRTEHIDGTMGNRVKIWQIRCFAEETQRLISLKIRNPLFKHQEMVPVLIFITSDWNETKSHFLDENSRLQLFKIFATDNLLNLTVTHIEMTSYGDNNKEAGIIWQRGAKSFLDWYFLTKMDYLIISRSGFGESASLHSLKPTRRFRHDKSNENGKHQCIFDDYYEEITTLRQSSANIDVYDIL